MAEALKVAHGEMAEELDGVGREHNEKLQVLGRTLVSGLYMLVRSVRMYEPTNRIFDRPLVQLQDVINQVIARDGRIELIGIKNAVYLNGMLVKVDAASLENVRQLLDDLRTKDVTGFTSVRPVQAEELKNFIAIFAKEQTLPAEDDGVPGKKLMAMKLARWSQLKDKVDSRKKDESLKLDRKKYALVVYARAVLFVQKYMESLSSEKPVNSAQALRVIQDLIDLSAEQRSHFLGVTANRPETDYLAYHQANTALMAIIFGAELGLTKQQRRDLGSIALLHEAGIATLPKELQTKTGPYTKDEREQMQRAPMLTIRQALREKAPLNRATFARVTTIAEYKHPFSGPKRQLNLYARIIAICSVYDALTSKRPFREAYAPDVALRLMGGEMGARFDPTLLRVFMKVMAIAPIKLAPKTDQTISIGG